MNGKPLWQSKTFWINFVALVGIVLTGAGMVGEPEWASYEAVALAAVNIVLRFVTGQPITGVIVTPPDNEQGTV